MRSLAPDPFDCRFSTEPARRAFRATGSSASVSGLRPCSRGPNEIYFHAEMDLVAGFCAQLYKNGMRGWSSLFADDARADRTGVFHLYYVFALDAAHGFFILRVPVPPDKPEFTSLTNAMPAANWQEREIQDLFGLKLDGHPNPRRCALHDDWPEVYPLRKDFDLHTALPPFQGERHKFREVEGEGVFQVPVGPVHAGIIEPGHFLFSVAGEPVLYLQIRLFYTHKGTEKLFENMPVTHGVRLAESISGDSSFRPRDRLLPCRRARRQRGSAAARARACARLPRTGAPSQPHRRHRRHWHRRGLRGRQHARHAAQGTRAAPQRTAHRQPSAARHGLPRRRALRLGRATKSRRFRN